jgi:hypothetical protein
MKKCWSRSSIKGHERRDTIFSDKDYANRLVETHFLLKNDLTARAAWRD